VGIQEGELTVSPTYLQCAVNNVLVDVVRTYLQNDCNFPFTSLNCNVWSWTYWKWKQWLEVS